MEMGVLKNAASRKTLDDRLGCAILRLKHREHVFGLRHIKKVFKDASAVFGKLEGEASIGELALNLIDMAPGNDTLCDEIFLAVVSFDDAVNAMLGSGNQLCRLRLIELFDAYVAVQQAAERIFVLSLGQSFFCLNEPGFGDRSNLGKFTKARKVLCGFFYGSGICGDGWKSQGQDKAS